MNNSEKAGLFAALQTLSESIPEMRVGQLVAAVGELCADLHGRGLWDSTDEELLEAAWQFQRNYKAAMQTATKPQAEPLYGLDLSIPTPRTGTDSSSDPSRHRSD
jgi:hypothetical protein